MKTRAFMGTNPDAGFDAYLLELFVLDGVGPAQHGIE
jgi:hypothetical protein